MSLNHHLLAKTTTDNVLQNFKTGEWQTVDNCGTELYRIGCNSNFPSPDAAFRDDSNDITITFEFKPPTETKRGILTGLGQSIAYLNSSNISYLVIPEYLEDYKIGDYISDLFRNQVVGKLPVGLITYENNTPTNVSLIHNVDIKNNTAFSNPISNNRFWAKHQDLPVPLFHLLLHCYYLKKIGQINGDAFAYCWDKYLFPSSNITNLKSTTVLDVSNNEIYTLSGRKKISFMEKRINKANKLSGQAKIDEINKITQDADTTFVGDNYYKSIKKNYITFLKHIEVVDSEGELTEDGFKLYHLGVVNGPDSKLFKDYFTKTVLLVGHHLDIIFDLENLCNDYKGISEFSEIKQKLYYEYEAKGMIKKNPNRVAGATSTVNFLKYEDILWNSLNLKGSSSGKPNNRFNWKSITEICSLPDL